MAESVVYCNVVMNLDEFKHQGTFALLKLPTLYGGTFPYKIQVIYSKFIWGFNQTLSLFL